MVKIIKVPAINGLGTTDGTELAPDKISEEGETILCEISDVEKQEFEIYKRAKKVKEKTIFIGGDHSISYPIIRSFLERSQKPRLIIFDAHPDLMPPMENPTHEEWLTKLIDEKLIEPQNIMLIGIRGESKNVSPKEMESAKEKRINVIYAHEFEEKKEEILKFAKENFYLSIDIDAFDKKDTPATGYPEKQGPEKESLIGIITKLAKLKTLKSADIVEINPTKPEAEKTIRLAKRVLEILKNHL
jgi:agmatinase